MSPEQYQGRSPDARADQFSFCVALYEALYEKRPFEARTAYELANKVILGELDRTPAGKVPPWLREVVVRGLRPRAEERFSSMRELIDALKNDPGAVRRKWLGAAAVVALLALVGAFELQLRQRRQLCRGGNAALAAVWNPERAAQAKASFLATGLPFAAYAFDQVERALDGYGHAWVAMHGEACEATRLRGEQSEEVLDLRMSCLSQHLQGLQASAGLFASADRQVVEKSAQVIAGLAPLSECSNVEALQTPLRPPKDAEQRANVEEVRAQLAQAIALRASAQYQKALLVAEAALHRARTLDYPPLTANAMLGLGDLQGSLRDDAAAHDTLSDAFETALASRDDLTASRAATRLLYLANVRGHPDEGHLWARLSGALLQRGAFEPLERARLDLQLGSLFSREARLDQALDHLRSALALFQGAHAAAEAATTRSAIAQVLRRQGKFPDALQEFELVLRSEEALLGAEHPDVGDIHDNIGAILQQQGKADEALVEMRRALAIYEKSLAPSHPRIAGAHINLAWMLLSQDKLPEALDEVRTGLALQEQARGSDQLEQAATDLTLGIILWRLGRFEEALVALRRGLALHDSAWGPEHIEAANYHLEIGIVLGDQGHFDEALEEMRLALAILNKSPGADPGEIGRVRDSMGSVLNSQGKPQLAMNEFRAALAIKEKVLGAEHPNTAITIGNIGESELKIGEYAQASEHLGRALSILEVKLPVPSVLGEFRFALAQSRWAAKRERPGAVALARQALGDFAKVQGTEKQTAEIEHWLGGHASMPAPR
jgi:tetratricopeptide (TPR) repeat protein